MFFPADVVPLAVLNNDTTPLHTPTLLPMSPHPAPAPPPPNAAAAHPPETERVSQYSESHITLSTPETLELCLNQQHNTGKIHVFQMCLPSFHFSGATRLVQ